MVALMLPDGAQFRLDPALASSAGALVLSLALFGGGLLWLRFGEAVYVERLIAAVAGCF